MSEMWFGGLGVAIVVHAIASIWWASKMTTTLEFLAKNMEVAITDIKSGRVDMRAELERELAKRDSQIAGLWKRVDENRSILMRHDVTLEHGRRGGANETQEDA